MIRRFRQGLTIAGAIGAAIGGLAAPAHAQDARSATAEVMTEEARRGLSWSGGRAAVGGDVRLSLGRLDASARAVTTRGSARHDGADAVIDLALGTGWDLGAVRVRADATGHAFAGARGRMDYVEAGVSAGYGYGPLYLTIGVTAAPSQRAIGGGNVYIHGDASAGIPGTPFTVLAGLGHSSGSVRDAERSARLRPGGDYADWRLGVEYRRDRLTLGVDYVGTDISSDDAVGRFTDRQHVSDRIVGRAQLSF